jgi:formamidopyrimidine-DNA glycosylase
MQSSWGGFEDNVSYVVTHNAMTGYFDWEHEPWTFDYVEGKRSSTPSDVRVLLTFESGRVLRFHDVRLFGRMDYSESLPSGVGPELMRTPNMMPGLRVITLRQFATLLESNWPVKSLLMQQSFVAGLGNIYANEGCHLAGLDPRTRACEVRPHLVPVLLEALRCVVSHSIPTVRYDWLNVYRRTRCGTCDRQVTRINLKGRATFICEGCQS